ncbi:MAG: hypothetical protein VW338_16565 [Rhodospirillaceae bacterium]
MIPPAKAPEDGSREGVAAAGDQIVAGQPEGASRLAGGRTPDAGGDRSDSPVAAGHSDRRSAMLLRYEAARRALEAARSSDEVLQIRSEAQAIGAYARQARDNGLIAGALEVQLRAEYRLGIELARGKVSGTVHRRGRKKGSAPEPLLSLADLGIGKKLAAAAQRLAQQSPEVFDERLAAMRADLIAGRKRASDFASSLRAGGFAGARATMAGRVEAPDSLDYFPTPPWATRALVESVLETPPGLQGLVAYDPACGEGHITGALDDYFGEVAGSDVHDYSAGGRSPPGWRGTFDYLDTANPAPVAADWIITNPPFQGKALAFALRALAEARTGVALFVQLRWLETVERFEKLFEPYPPTAIGIFAERVNLCRGCWQPDGTTATAYCWLVWQVGVEPQPPIWIPPGRREALTRPDDRARFTAHPVTAQAR